MLALLSDSLAGGPTGERSPEFFRWKHEASPFGRSPRWWPSTTGRVVGLRTFMRWEFGSGGSSVRAVRAVDTATDEAHRGRGIFKLLTLAALDQMAGTADLVFNTPNSNSLPGYLKMGWQRVAEVPIQVRPVRPLHFLRGIRSAREVTAATDADRASCRLQPAAEVLRRPRRASTTCSPRSRPPTLPAGGCTPGAPASTSAGGTPMLPVSTTARSPS